MQTFDLDEIQERLNKNLPQPKESVRVEPSAETLPDDSPLWELWERMSETYGYQWVSQHGEEPSDTWIQGLADLTLEQYATGFRAIFDRPDRWPPNLAEFRQLATGKDGLEWERRCHVPYVPEQCLPDLGKKERTAIAAEKAIKEMRELMGI